MANKRYLLIVEGIRDEINIFSSVLKKYGFESAVMSAINFSNLADFNFEQLKIDDIDVFIAESKQSRIHDIVIKFNEKTDDIDRFFGVGPYYFQGIFLIFDIDHNDKDDLSVMFKKFSDESNGMLLVNCPSLEVIGDYDYPNCKTKVFHSITKEYKGELNKYYQEKEKCNIWEYITAHFDELVIKFLEQNRKDFDENNVMEHPRLVVEKINQLNERINKRENEKMIRTCIYRYYTTVIYVFIAHIKGLTKEINNYEQVYKFFLDNAKAK